LGSDFAILIAPLNMTIAMASYQRLARKSAQMMAKMKALKDEVETMATQIEQKKDETERKRQEEAGELSLGGLKEKDPRDRADDKSAARELTPSEAEWIDDNINDPDSEYIFSHGFNTNQVDLAEEENDRAKEDLKRMQMLKQGAEAVSTANTQVDRVPTPERKGPAARWTAAQKMAQAAIARAIAEEAQGLPVQSRKSRMEQLRHLIKDKARKRGDATPEQKETRILAWKAELAALEGDPRIDVDGLPPEHELAHAGKSSSKKGTS